ncbi:hypothetical protein Q7P37_006156 [Cladosporium fusiforme]
MKFLEWKPPRLSDERVSDGTGRAQLAYRLQTSSLDQSVTEDSQQAANRGKERKASGRLSADAVYCMCMLSALANPRGPCAHRISCLALLLSCCHTLESLVSPPGRLIVTPEQHRARSPAPSSVHPFADLARLVLLLQPNKKKPAATDVHLITSAAPSCQSITHPSLCDPRFAGGSVSYVSPAPLLTARLKRHKAPDHRNLPSPSASRDALAASLKPSKKHYITTTAAYEPAIPRLVSSLTARPEKAAAAAAANAKRRPNPPSIRLARGLRKRPAHRELASNPPHHIPPRAAFQNLSCPLTRACPPNPENSLARQRPGFPELFLLAAHPARESRTPPHPVHPSLTGLAKVGHSTLLLVPTSTDSDGKRWQTEMDITMIGLQNAGKTSLLRVLAGGEFTIDSIPTVGFNMKRVQKGHVTLKCWDLGGQPRFRSMWERYCRGVNAIVFIVDSADKEALPVAKEELHILLEKPAMEGIPLLVLGNKSDLRGHLTVDDLIDALELKRVTHREVSCYGISAKEETNLDAVLQWLIARSTKKGHEETQASHASTSPAQTDTCQRIPQRVVQLAEARCAGVGVFLFAVSTRALPGLAAAAALFLLCGFWAALADWLAHAEKQGRHYYWAKGYNWPMQTRGRQEDRLLALGWRYAVFVSSALQSKPAGRRTMMINVMMVLVPSCGSLPSALLQGCVTCVAVAVSFCRIAEEAYSFAFVFWCLRRRDCGSSGLGSAPVSGENVTPLPRNNTSDTSVGLFHCFSAYHLRQASTLRGSRLGIMILLPRQYNYNCRYSNDPNCYRNNRSTWDRWARWLVLGLIIFGAVMIFFLFSCVTARRRRKRGYQPYRGTGWTLGRAPAGHGQATYNSQPHYGQQQQQWQPPPQQQYQQPYYNNSNNAPPSYYDASRSGGNDVELQSPQPAYGGQGAQQYQPPKGPPPGQA